MSIKSILSYLSFITKISLFLWIHTLFLLFNLIVHCLKMLVLCIRLLCIVSVCVAHLFFHFLWFLGWRLFIFFLFFKGNCYCLDGESWYLSIYCLIEVWYSYLLWICCLFFILTFAPSSTFSILRLPFLFS